MTHVESLGVASGAGRFDLKRPVLTARWLKDALTAGRSAFEREMRRERRSLDAEFERFWKENSAREA
ncbi:MAG: hypothetical protein ACE5HF_01680 [Gemmatimonadota bacterium]